MIEQILSTRALRLQSLFSSALRERNGSAGPPVSSWIVAYLLKIP
jgi:hypothetical protein